MIEKKRNKLFMNRGTQTDLCPFYNSLFSSHLSQSDPTSETIECYIPIEQFITICNLYREIVVSGF
jgi:hypothetical protein